MAVTKIWNIRGKAGSPLKYVTNPDKTEREFTESEKQALQDVMLTVFVVPLANTTNSNIRRNRKQHRKNQYAAPCRQITGCCRLLSHQIL